MSVILSWIPTQDSIISKLKKTVVLSWIPTQDSINLNDKKNNSLEFVRQPGKFGHDRFVVQYSVFPWGIP